MMKTIQFSTNRHFLSMILLAIFITLSCGFSATAKPVKDKRVTAAAAAYENGEFEKALQLFKDAYADDPQSSYLYNIGRVYESNADYPNAVEYYKKFIQTPGSDEEARGDAAERIKNINEIMSLTGSSSKSSKGSSLPAGACVDINNGSAKDLTALNGIGEKKAQDIIAGRPYRSIDELTKVKGIGPGTVNKLRDQVCPLGGTSAPVAAPSPAPAAMPAPPKAVAAAPAAPAGCIDINNASQKDLTKLAGVGDKKAQDIIAGRPYHSVDDLTKVKGIGPAAVNKIRDQVCPLGNAATPAQVKPVAEPKKPAQAAPKAPQPPSKSNTIIEI